MYSNVTYYEYYWTDYIGNNCYKFANGKSAKFAQSGISTSFILYSDESCTTVRRTIDSNNCDVDTYFQADGNAPTQWTGYHHISGHINNCFNAGFVQLVMSSVQRCRNDSVIYLQPVGTTTVINREVVYNEMTVDQMISTTLTNQVEEIVLSLKTIDYIHGNLTVYNDNFDEVFSNMNTINQKIEILETQMTNMISLLEISNSMVTTYLNNQIQIQNQLSQLLIQDSAKMLEYSQMNNNPTATSDPTPTETSDPTPIETDDATLTATASAPPGETSDPSVSMSPSAVGVSSASGAVLSLAVYLLCMLSL
jgi:hypothetical protein